MARAKEGSALGRRKASARGGCKRGRADPPRDLQEKGVCELRRDVRAVFPDEDVHGAGAVDGRLAVEGGGGSFFLESSPVRQAVPPQPVNETPPHHLRHHHLA